MIGPFVSASNGNTVLTTLTISQADLQISKDGAAFAQTSGTAGATNAGGGHYTFTFTTNDTNTCGALRLRVNESGACPYWVDYEVVPADDYNALVKGTDQLQVDVIQFGGNTSPVTSLTAERVNTLDYLDLSIAAVNTTAARLNTTQLARLDVAVSTVGSGVTNASVATAVQSALNTALPATTTANSAYHYLVGIDATVLGVTNAAGSVVTFKNRSNTAQVAITYSSTDGVRTSVSRS